VQPIENADRRHQRIDLVEAIVASANDPKREINLGRSEQFHAGQVAAISG
jgi:hypothetical protein